MTAHDKPQVQLTWPPGHVATHSHGAATDLTHAGNQAHGSARIGTDRHAPATLVAHSSAPFSPKLAKYVALRYDTRTHPRTKMHWLAPATSAFYCYDVYKFGGIREMSVWGIIMAIRHLAVSLLLFFCFVLRGKEPDSTSRRSSPGDNHSPPAREGKEARTLGKKAGVAVDAKDWPMYNCDVLGWRHNAGETALSKADVARLEEKWRFPPKGADFEIGVIHATPVVVNGYVYFGTVNKAAFYKLTPDGKVKWSFRLNEKDDRVNRPRLGSSTVSMAPHW